MLIIFLPYYNLVNASLIDFISFEKNELLTVLIINSLLFSLTSFSCSISALKILKIEYNLWIKFLTPNGSIIILE